MKASNAYRIVFYKVIKKFKIDNLQILNNFLY